MNKSTIALMMAMLSGTAYAESTQLTPNFSPESVTVSTSAGMLSGKSHEMVYDTGTGRKVSQLDWKIKNVAILKGDISSGCIFVSDTECTRLDIHGFRGWSYGRL